MFIFSQIWGYIVTGLVAIYQAVLRYPIRAILLLGVAVTHGLAFYGGLAWQRGDFTDGERASLVQSKKRPTAPSDLLRSKPLDRLYLAPEPPKKEVDTVVVEVPRFVTNTDTVFRPISEASSIENLTQNSIRLDTPLQRIEKGFLVLPLVDGSPAVSVTQDRTLIDTFNPTGAGNVRLSYTHPKDIWGLGAVASVGINDLRNTPKPQTKIGGYLRYKRYTLKVGTQPLDKFAVGISIETRVGFF